jgi:hypothetical protein
VEEAAAQQIRKEERETRKKRLGTGPTGFESFLHALEYESILFLT